VGVEIASKKSGRIRVKKALLGLLFAVLSLGGAFIAHQTFAAEQIDNTPDCDTVAIVRCGSMTESAVRANYTKGDVATVYGAFGIRQSHLSGSFVSGVVWKDGRVTVGNTTVATGAVTAGRWNNPASDMKRIAGTDRAYVMSPKHFVTSGQTAWLKFDANGKFLFAIIKSCGNPVTAKAITPKFTCDQLTVTPISRVSFRYYVKASAAYAHAAKYTYDFGDGKKLDSSLANTSHTYAKPGTYTARVTITFKLLTNGAIKTVTSTACTYKITVKPAPSYSCDQLKATQITRNQYRFDAKGSAANGAKITAYNFNYGDGTTRTIPTNGSLTNAASHTYTKPGNYTATLSLTVSVDGASKTVTSNACKVPVSVAPEASYSCDSLTQSKISRTEFKFNAAASAANGATISKYTFNFGDGKTADVTTAAKTATANHTYDKAGTYTAKVSVTVKVGTATKVVEGPKCSVSVTVEQEPTYSCDELTKNQISRTNYGFNAKASAAGGATIASYHFDYGDGKTEDKTTSANTVATTHEFAKAGEYTVKVTVNVNVAGSTKPVTSDKCVVKVTVQEEEKPVFECKSLTVDLIGKKEDRTFKYNLSYTAENGATLKNVDFDFGDNTDVKTVTPAELANVTHAYAKDGEYTTVATLHFNVNDTVQDKKCSVKVNPQNPECKPGIPVGDERCKEECKPGIPVGDARCNECKPGIPAGDERCEECKPGVPMGDDRCEEHILPASIPSTGPEAIVGGLFGTGALGYGIYNYMASRRALRDSMKR
jgi:PKD repeat protein